MIEPGHGGPVKLAPGGSVRQAADWRWRFAALAVLLAGTAVRIVGLADLRVFGDSASSVYFATRNLQAIAAETALDSHPPLYYFLLRLSLELYGHNEVAARLPSLIAGILLIAVLLAAGRRLSGGIGRSMGLWSGILAAVSPPLVYYSRLPRMYALVALLSTLVLLLSVGNKRVRKRRITLTLLGFSALMAHYFAVIPVTVAGSILLVQAWRGSQSPMTSRLRETAQAVMPVGLAMLLWIPWLLYALPASLSHTSRTISGVAPPASLAEFLGELLVFVPVGTFVELSPSIGLALTAWVAVSLFLVFNRPPIRWPIAAFLMLCASAAAVYFVAPEFARPRFFIPMVPVGLLALASTGKSFRAVPPLAVIFGVAVAALPATFELERSSLELDSVRLAERLDAVGRPDDAVVLQAWWQAGFLYLHSRQPIPSRSMRDLRESEVDVLLAEHPTVWLAVYQVGRGDPNYPEEQWFDQRAYRVDETLIGPTRLVRYLRRGKQGDVVRSVFDNRIELVGAPAVSSASAGDSLPVYLRWLAVAPIDDRYVGFIHLVDSTGRGWAGRDEEPEGGARPTAGWRPGDVYDQYGGLSVPLGTPPGDYRLLAGLYRRGDGNRLTGPNGDTLALGQVRVLPPSDAVGKLALLGSDLALLRSSVQATNDFDSVKRTIATVDGPQTFTLPVDARSPGVFSVLLWWKTTGVLPSLTTFVHVLDERGGIVVQADGIPFGGAYPTSRWPVGETVVDRVELAVPPGTPAGRFRVLVGMYGQDGRRLPVFPASKGVNGDAVEIGFVEIGPPL